MSISRVIASNPAFSTGVYFVCPIKTVFTEKPICWILFDDHGIPFVSTVVEKESRFSCA
jgi:hypothetical protein